MPEPVLVLLAGPNGAGKSTLAARITAQADLEFVNADVIAAERWPGEEEARSYEAAQIAATRRSELLASRRSFATETVFSHESKVDLLHAARNAGFVVALHIVMIPEDLAVARVESRVRSGGHSVPEEKIRTRYRRLWSLIAQSAPLCETATFYDNSSASEPYRVVAEFSYGHPTQDPTWPAWAPPELIALST